MIHQRRGKKSKKSIPPFLDIMRGKEIAVHSRGPHGKRQNVILNTTCFGKPQPGNGVCDQFMGKVFTSLPDAPNNLPGGCSE
jgi:hypothetical protein